MNMDGRSSVCRTCGKTFPEAGSPADTTICAACLIAAAEQAIPEQTPELPQKQGLSPAFSVIRYATIAAALVLMTVRFGTISESLRPRHPLREGSVTTDRVADKCITALWKISHEIQNAPQPALMGFYCPASARPYVITVSSADITAACPDPARHRLASVSVSRRQPIPRAEALPETASAISSEKEIAP